MKKVGKVKDIIYGRPDPSVPEQVCPDCGKRGQMLYHKDWMWCGHCKTLWDWKE
ncbi:MAG: hypothetical protein A4E32_01513 [Methanomassiliicoccales archaeon PtaU1.Bin124]|nr:MAG: hypothetical protein A4E32_01513 [Methanomassiliicoccales archaeon PtaU1.Bin124]